MGKYSNRYLIGNRNSDTLASNSYTFYFGKKIESREE